MVIFHSYVKLPEGINKHPRSSQRWTRLGQVLEAQGLSNECWKGKSGHSATVVGSLDASQWQAMVWQFFFEFSTKNWWFILAYALSKPTKINGNPRVSHLTMIYRYLQYFHGGFSLAMLVATGGCHCVPASHVCGPWVSTWYQHVLY